MVLVPGWRMIHPGLHFSSSCEFPKCSCWSMLVGATPLHLLSQTALPRKSPTGAFIAALRFANAIPPQTLPGTSTINWNLSGQGPSICSRRPRCRVKAPLGLSLLRCASQTRSHPKPCRERVRQTGIYLFLPKYRHTFDLYCRYSFPNAFIKKSSSTLTICK